MAKVNFSSLLNAQMTAKDIRDSIFDLIDFLLHSNKLNQAQKSKLARLRSYVVIKLKTL